MDLITVILSIVEEGMKLWSDIRRTRFIKQHHKLLQEIMNAENTSSPDYTDDRLMLAYEQLRIYLEAYRSELKENAVETLQQKSG